MIPPTSEEAAFSPASRLRSIGVSDILQITAKAAAMKKQGRPIIALAAGEPDFDTPDHVKEAAARAIHEGDTKYTQLDGSPGLKAAIIEKFKRDNGLTYTPEQIIVCTGAKQVIFNAFMATLNPGDEVIVTAPYWTSYADIISICGGKMIALPTRETDSFRLTAQTLEDAITPRTRWFLLNSPSNPAGTVYPEAELRPLLEVLLRNPHVWLLSDDIYEHIVYDDLKFVTGAQLEPRLKERTLTVNGVSKAFAMTGWRIGYGGGPRSLIRAMAVVQSQSTSCPSSISQAAALAALNGPQDIIIERCRIFQARRDKVTAALNITKSLTCRPPMGAFYALAGCASVSGLRTPENTVLGSDVDFCLYLLDNASVAIVPGSCFGLESFVRLSYAASDSDLEEACDRIEAACSKLS